MKPADIPVPGAALIYTDLHNREVRCRFVEVRMAYDPLQNTEHVDPTFWRVELLDDAPQLGRKAGEVANVATRFLSEPSA